MGLLERVTVLIRADLDDMIDQANEPERMLEHVILDIQNQFVQLKTRLAIAIAEQHALESYRRPQAVSCRETARGLCEQITDQKLRTESLKSALSSLQARLEQALAKQQVLLAQTGVSGGADRHSALGQGTKALNRRRREGHRQAPA